MDIVPIFETFGLPVAVIIALMWYIVYSGKQYQDRLQQMSETHKQETQAYTEALSKNTDVISRNTVVLERLCVMLGDKEGTV